MTPIEETRNERPDESHLIVLDGLSEDQRGIVETAANDGKYVDCGADSEAFHKLRRGMYNNPGVPDFGGYYVEFEGKQYQMTFEEHEP
jgi:hypothetical protein